MPTERIVIIGAGGHAKVVLDASLASGLNAADLEVRDDAPSENRVLLQWPVRHPAVDESIAGARFHVAIGHALTRAALFRMASAAGATPLTLIHPAACTSPFAAVGAGSFIAARAILAPDARIGLGVIVNHGAVVDHDCRVGDFSHIAPNASLGGGVVVGDEVLVGAGANLLPGVRVGSGAVIGAGAVVTHDVAPGQTWAGVPARRADSESGRRL